MVNVQKDRDAHVLVDMHEVLHDLFGRDRVERRDRLVGKDDLRVLRERARERHALLLAAGELVGAHIRLIENADLVERFERLDLVRFPERAEQHAPERHIRHARGQNVLDNARARHEIERLEHHADAAAETPQALAGERAHIRAVHRQRAGGDPVHPVHRAQQRGLARTGAADDRSEFAVGDREIYIVQPDRAVGIYLGNVVKYNHTDSSFLYSARGGRHSGRFDAVPSSPQLGKCLSWRRRAPG